MSCVLRISLPNIEGALKGLPFFFYRVNTDTAHFNVSDENWGQTRINTGLA